MVNGNETGMLFTKRMSFMVERIYYHLRKCTAPAVFICYTCPFLPHNRKSQDNNSVHIVNALFKHWLLCSTVSRSGRCRALCQETHRNEFLIKVAWCDSGSRQACIANSLKRKCSKAQLKAATCATETNLAIQPCGSTQSQI